MNYTKFSDEDLFDSYQTTLDYSGKLDNDLLLEMEKRGGIEELRRTLETQKAFPLEVKRIYKTVAEMKREGQTLEAIQSEITSDIIPEDRLPKFVEKQFIQIEENQKDISIDSQTIIRTILGMIIATSLCTLLWFESLFYSGHMYFILIPGFVIISYFILRLLTGKSSRNVIVYLGTFFSVLISIVAGIAMYR